MRIRVIVATMFVSVGPLVNGCKAPLDNLQVVLARHAEAMADVDEASQERLTKYGDPILGEQAKTLLPEDVLSLTQARSIAVRANPDVHAAQARLQAVAERIVEARSRYYPNISFAHNFTRTFHTPASRNRLSTSLQPIPFVPSDVASNSIAVTSLLNAVRRPLFGLIDVDGDSTPFSEHSTAFSSTWTLFDGFIREAQLMAAKYLHQASAHSLLDVQRLIIQSVDAAYYQVQLAGEQLRIATADEVFSRERYEETRKLQEAGRATSADVDNFRIRVLTAQANVTGAIGLRETGRVVLAELMGLPLAILPPDLALSPLADETKAEMALPDVEPWLARAMRHRPDLLQLEEVLKSKTQDVRGARGLYMPTVTASASWGFDRSETLRYTIDDQSSAAGMEVRWELYTAGRREALIRGAQSARAEAAATLNRLRLSVAAQVRRAIIDLNDAQQQIRLQRENLITASENRRVVRAGYSAGTETLNRLNEAQRDFITADADLALARIRLRQAWSDLRTSIGTNGTDDPALGGP